MTVYLKRLGLSLLRIEIKFTLTLFAHFLWAHFLFPHFLFPHFLFPHFLFPHFQGSQRGMASLFPNTRFAASLLL